ncbi:hypothetical protein EDD86DRAFT_229820 [Gorgonomyces haynaldii]|nr:hypothetical protein EDD86DRAFT_229820 [Gorgonomyces haynaldii]
MSHGVCRLCKEQVIGSHISTTLHKYHKDCFVCNHCLQPFEQNLFFEIEGLYFCEKDYNLLYGARCGRCCELITGKCISALDNKWHLEHFTCDDCGRSLVGASFIRKNDKPYCKSCPAKQAKPQEEKNLCQQCQKPLSGEVLTFKGLKYHPYHYHCKMCKKELDQRAKEYDGDLYCLEDYQKLMSQTCFGCRRPITGRSISALGKIYHPDHFVCFKCELPFHGNPYYEYKGKPYDELHYKEAIGALCPYCWQPATGVVISALASKYCGNHFMCMGCFTNLSDEKSEFVDWDNKPFCRGCFDRLPSETKTHVRKYREMEKKLL